MGFQYGVTKCYNDDWAHCDGFCHGLWSGYENKLSWHILVSLSESKSKTLRITDVSSWELTYPQKSQFWVDDFPFPKVGWVGSLEGSNLLLLQDSTLNTAHHRIPKIPRHGVYGWVQWKEGTHLCQPQYQLADQNWFLGVKHSDLQKRWKKVSNDLDQFEVTLCGLLFGQSFVIVV